MTPNPIADIVADTLRYVAEWMPEGLRETLADMATNTRGAWDSMACPVCEEVTCDEGCPLRHIRTPMGL